MSKQNGWLSLLLLSLLCPGILSFVTKSPSTAMSSTTAIKGLAQFAPEAASLFHNMNTPASILAGSVVPLGFLGALEIEGPANESKIIKTLRVLYSVVAVMTFASEILVVIWSTVSTNRLIETTIAPAESVWALLKRDFELEWAATNAHFVAGMLGFLFLVGTKMYFHVSGGILGQCIAAISTSSLLLMMSIVNRRVAYGSGDGLRYGSSVIHLWTTYIRLLLKRATSIKSVGLLEIGSIILLAAGVERGVRFVLYANASKGK